MSDETEDAGPAGDLPSPADAAASLRVDAILADPKTVTIGGGGSGDIREFDVARLNDLYALVIVGGRSVILEENWKILGAAETPPHERIRFVSLEAFAHWHANDLYRVEDKWVSAAQLWLRDRARRQYRGIVFDPGKPPGGASGTYYNLWQGFSVEPAPGASCDIFLDHVRTNVASGNEGHACFILAWFADMVQRPADRKGVALVLRGKMGTGKTVVGLHAGRLFEANYALVDDPRHIVGNFNAHLASLLLLQADEGFWAGDKQAEGRLKGLITSDRQMIELKGKDPIQVRNHVHLLVTSNADWVVPAGHDERRFAVFDVGDHCQQDHEYFAAMAAELEGGGYGKLLHVLQTFDLRPINLRLLPKTEALYEQKVASLPAVEAWWFTCLERGWITHEPAPGGAPPPPGEVEAEPAVDNWEEPVEIGRVHRAYLYFCERGGIRHRKFSPQFGIDLRRLVPGLGRGKKWAGRGQARHYSYRFPPLDDCRAAFEALLKTEIDWETGAAKPAASTQSTQGGSA